MLCLTGKIATAKPTVTSRQHPFDQVLAGTTDMLRNNDSSGIFILRTNTLDYLPMLTADLQNPRA